MKKYKLLITGLSLAFLVSSCDDRLELNPHDQISAETALNTPGDFENAVNGLYTLMIDGQYYGADFMSFPDVLADNLIFNPGGRQTQRSTFEWRYNANDTRGAFMADAADVIQHANFILANINKLSDGATKDNIKAQALAARALALFNQSNVFGKIPTQSSDANSSLGVPVISSSDITVNYSRNTVSEVYTSIIEDLEEAKTLISNNGIERFNLNAVNALLSRVYLYNGDWQNAIDSANNVTTNVSSITNFGNIWNDASDAGVIFELKNFDADTNVSTGVPYSQTLPPDGILSEYVVAFDFAALYQNNDVRRSAYINTSAYGSAGIYNHVAKYLSSSVNTGSGVVDIKIVRAAEVYLNKAEAHAELNQDVLALAALDMVRSNRYTSFTSPGETGQALKDAIALERRLELAFEGHRFFDIKRKGLAINRGNFGEFSDGSGTAPVYLNLPAGDCRFELPISKTEIDVNPNMEQNPCY